MKHHFLFSVEYGCGRSTNENCSYFVSASTVDAGECRLRVCPCSEHICQIRLDFDTFVVNQPSGACKFWRMIFVWCKTLRSILYVIFQQHCLSWRLEARVIMKLDNAKLTSLVLLLQETMLHLQFVVQILENTVSTWFSFVAENSDKHIVFFVSVCWFIWYVQWSWIQHWIRNFNSYKELENKSKLSSW